MNEMESKPVNLEMNGWLKELKLIQRRIKGLLEKAPYRQSVKDLLLEASLILSKISAHINHPINLKNSVHLVPQVLAISEIIIHQLTNSNPDDLLYFIICLCTILSK